jgi:hypothetical protein
MKRILIILSATMILMGQTGGGCGGGASASQPKSSSGVKKAKAKVTTGTDGLTTEQRNVKSRVEEDNKPGAVKHLYVISSWSGQVIIYSTVKGKVTSGGKRLTPTTVAATDGQYVGNALNGVPVSIGGRNHRTPEVLQDDGTYGSSMNYLFWWDVQGRYHQHYVTGGQILHISDHPLKVKGIIINMELTQPKRNK